MKLKLLISFFYILCCIPVSTFAFDFDDLAEPIPEAPPQIVAEPPKPAPLPPLKPEDLGIPIDLPVIGTFYLLPFTDTKKDPPESGFKINIAQVIGTLDLGALTIDQGDVRLVGGKLGLFGQATLFGQKATIGIKNVSFGDKGRINKVVLGVTFTQQPSIELIPGMQATFTQADIELERNKPTMLVATLELFKQTVRVALELNAQQVNGFIELPSTKLSNIIPQVAATPSLAQGMVTKARIDIINIWNKNKQPENSLQATIKGTVQFPVQNLTTTLVSPQPPAATTPTAAPTAPGQDLGFETLVDVGQTTVANQTPANPAPKDMYIFDMQATLTKKGIVATLTTDQLEIPAVGIIEAAHIDINTQKTPASMSLKGAMKLSVTDIGTLDVAINSAITSQGIAFTGTIPKEFSFAGLTLKNFFLTFDTQKKVAALDGNLFLPMLSNVTLQAHLLLLPDPTTPANKIVQFTTKTSSQEFRPFSGIPGLETFYIKDFDAGLEVVQRAGTTTKSFYLNGDFYIAGVPLKSVLKFVENAAGQKGVYVNAPLTKDKKLSDIFPDLKGPIFDGILFKEAMFIASTINFVDINPTTQATTAVDKGLSFLAAVPLEGTLKPVGKFLGSTEQTFTLFGKIFPQLIRASELGFILSQGYPEPDKAVSMGQTRVLFTGIPSFGVDTNIIFRPTPQDELKFVGAFKFNPTDVEIQASMKGMWKNPFGLPKSSVSDLLLGVGMAYGSPGLPTKLTGGGALTIGDFAAQAYFAADAAIKDIAIKAEIKEGMSMSQLATKILKGAFDINIGELKIPDPELKYLMLEAAAQDIMIGTELVRQGLAFKAEMPMFGTTAYVDIMVRPPSFGGGGFKIFGAMEPVSIGNGFLTITKSSKEYGGSCFIPTTVTPCAVPDLAEIKKAGEDFAQQKKEDNRPRVDIELTLQRQNFLISGNISVANLYSSDACMSIDNRGMRFMFEQAMKTGDEIVMWKGKPLFLSRVIGTGTVSLSQSPTFMVSIDFMQNLQEYVKDKAKESFTTAQQAIIDGIATAKREIDTAKQLRAQAASTFKQATEQVQQAQAVQEDIEKAIMVVQEKMEQTRATLQSLRQQRQQLQAEFDEMPTVCGG